MRSASVVAVPSLCIVAAFAVAGGSQGAPTTAAKPRIVGAVTAVMKYSVRVGRVQVGPDGVPWTWEKSLHPLRARDKLTASSRGRVWFRLDGRAFCFTRPHRGNGVVKVQPRANVLLDFRGGVSSCGTTSQRQKTMLAGAHVTITARDPIFEVVVAGNRVVVKLRRGTAVVAGRSGRRRAVVLALEPKAAKQVARQVIVPARGDPRPPTMVTLTPREQMGFKKLAKPLPASRDRTPPVASILKMPTDPSADRSPTFTLTSSEPSVTYSCALDNADFRLCPNPQTYSNLDPGRHTFYVRATDAAGNTGPIALYEWSIERPASAPIAFESNRDGNYEIYLVNPDGGRQTRLTNSAQVDVDPAWSPDNRKLAFESARDLTGPSEIYVMNADGSQPTRLTTNPANDRNPKWSPFGRQIAFESNRDGNYEIYVMNADGNGPERLTTISARDSDPAWSPNGRKIVFESDRDGNSELYVMNADGSEQTKLTMNTAGDFSPAWSPDGLKIAFESDRDGNHELYVMNADGSSQIRLTTNAARDSDPAWSPDGSRIAFASDRDGNLEIYVMNADGTNQRRLTTSAGEDLVPNW
jgi:Tol biopolymer transport system component